MQSVCVDELNLFLQRPVVGLVEQQKQNDEKEFSFFICASPTESGINHSYGPKRKSKRSCFAIYSQIGDAVEIALPSATKFT